jgi:hypothetical protein
MTNPRFWRLVALMGGMAFVAMVATNALILQKGRHPAPLFGGTGGSPSENPALIAKPVRAQPIAGPSQPIGAPAGNAEQAPVVAANPVPAAPPPAVGSPSASALLPPPRPHSANPTPPSERRDPIARLLEGDAENDLTQPTRATVLLAQRALQKIGYVIRPDGVMGATTRQALELFQRQRGLPVDGELSARVRRELSTASGLAVE